MLKYVRICARKCLTDLRTSSSEYSNSFAMALAASVKDDGIGAMLVICVMKWV